MAVTQISPDPQFSQGRMHYDYNATSFKTMKEMKIHVPNMELILQYHRTNSGLSQAEWLITYDWKHSQNCHPPGEVLQFRT